MDMTALLSALPREPVVPVSMVTESPGKAEAVMMMMAAAAACISPDTCHIC